jgi:hypothetical protein
MDHLDSDEHAAERAALVAAVIAACSGGEVEPGAIERLGAVIGRIYDIGCEFELDVTIAANAVKRHGEARGYLDRLAVTFEFPDAKEIREEEHREHIEREIKHERSN